MPETITIAETPEALRKKALGILMDVCPVGRVAYMATGVHSSGEEVTLDFSPRSSGDVRILLTSFYRSLTISPNDCAIPFPHEELTTAHTQEYARYLGETTFQEGVSGLEP